MFNRITLSRTVHQQLLFEPGDNNENGTRCQTNHEDNGTKESAEDRYTRKKEERVIETRWKDACQRDMKGTGLRER